MFKRKGKSEISDDPLNAPVDDAPAVDAPDREGYTFDKILIGRLVLASVLFAVALTGKMTDLLSAIFLVLSAIAAGYDLVTEAITDVSAGHYFEAPLIIVFSAVVSFAIGFGSEGAALLILFRIGLLLIEYTKARTISSAVDFIPQEQDDVISHMTLLFSDEDTGKTALRNRVSGIMGIVTKVILGAAVVYAVVLPLLSDYNYTVSIHRAITLMVIAAPVSVLSSLRLCDVVGMGFAAASGIVCNSSAAFDRTRNISTVIFDKTGVFSDGKPRIASVKSSLLKTDVFIKIAAHIAHYSLNPAEKAVVDAYQGNVMDEVLKDYKELPGCGSEIIVEGISMCFGNRDMMALKGVRVPDEDIKGASTLYMSIAGRYVGCVTLSEGVNPESAAIVSEYRDAGIENCALISGEDSGASLAFASSVGVAEFYSQCEGDKKLSAVEQSRKNVQDGALLFLYSGQVSHHSAADIDACVDTSDSGADISLTKAGIREIPFAMSVSARSHVVEEENVAGTLLIKVLIIFLTLIGFCNLWFAVFLDMATALGAILNTIRVSMPPLFTFVKKD